jgi:hypothetical protein
MTSLSTKKRKKKESTFLFFPGRKKRGGLGKMARFSQIIEFANLASNGLRLQKIFESFFFVRLFFFRERRKSSCNK